MAVNLHLKSKSTSVDSFENEKGWTKGNQPVSFNGALLSLIFVLGAQIILKMGKGITLQMKNFKRCGLP